METKHDLNTVFVARFYAGGVLVHVQTGTLPELAVLCHKGGSAAEIAIGDALPIGRLAVDGRMFWY